MSDFLKGNFEVKNKVVEKKSEKSKPEHVKIREEFRKRALASISGSMVYVERTDLTWDGDES